MARRKTPKISKDEAAVTVEAAGEAVPEPIDDVDTTPLGVERHDTVTMEAQGDVPVESAPVESSPDESAADPSSSSGSPPECPASLL